MHARFRVIETTTLDDGSKRYRNVDLVEGGSANKHGVFKVRTEADAVCSTLNAEHPRPAGARDAVPHNTY
ncbi:hypothetical protein DBR45_08625 [Pseudomonas sp. HMWF031]|nr:hypothetical protein DBR45_08625 [Pseudomonas sp. HMWF031]